MHPLKFRHDFRVEVLHGEGVLLLSERDHLYLSGRAYELLAPLLNGRYTEDEIIDRLEGKAPLEELYYALEVLKKKRYVIEIDSHVSEDVAVYWNSLGIDTRRAREKLSKASVRLHAFGNVSKKEILSAFRSLAIKASHGPASRRRYKFSAFPVVVTDDYLRPELKKWNRQMLRKKAAWMILKPAGNTIWLGPIFVPSKTGCWQCLAQRLSANREVEEFVQRKKRRFIPTSKASMQSTRNIAANLAATEILRWLVEEKNDRMEGKVVTLDCHTLESRSHVLVRRPQCPECDDSSQRKKNATAIVLQSAPVSQSENGFHRSLPPEQTLRKYQDHISPITGVVTQLIRVTEPEIPLPLYLAGHNIAMKDRNVHMLRQSLRSKSSGKGKTDLYAKVSALCEAVERYSGNFTGDEIRIRARYTELQAEAIDPQDLMLISNNQYANRKEWNARNSALHFIPEPFQTEARLDWTPAWSLTHSAFKYVPTAYCYYGYPQKLKETFCLADSNGNASGNTMEEAILHGFMELAERDSVAIWWYNRLARPGVDLNSLNEPYYEELKRYYESIHREFWVLDLTTDLEIPSFAAISRRTDQQEEEITFGFGAHFDAKLAVLRAVTEMGQLLPRFGKSQDGQKDYDFDDQEAIDWWRNATIAKNSYLMPDPTRKAMGLTDYPKYETEDLRDDVLRCLQIARNHKMEMLVLDQTIPDIGMPVAKVMVPGLRHFWARFGPGRLYDVPVRQGWLQKRKRESELNPVPMFV